MSLLTVVQDVCAVVGVSRPSSIFSGLNSSRTQQEMLALANEMAQRIAYNTREWGVLKLAASFLGSTGVPPPPAMMGYLNFALPADFKRMLLTTNVRRRSTPALPLRFIADTDEWLERRFRGYNDYRGEWSLISDQYISVAPAPAATDEIFFLYLVKDCIALNGGGNGEVFTNDNDRFRLDERLLKLGMIWQWKANKGSPYAEDMGTYSDALAVASGADTPAPIIIGRLPISSAANVAIPWPSTWGPQP
jgi:hypothetical protein